MCWSLVLIVVGHNRVCEGVTCDAHSLVRQRTLTSSTFVIIDRQADLGQYNRRLIVLDDRVVVAESVGIDILLLRSLLTANRSSTLVFFDALELSTDH